MRIGKVKNTQLIVNNYFLVLMVLFGMVGLLSKALIVFTVVLLHECAHTVIATRYGLRVREMELLPFGGVARIEGMSDLPPHQELRIALVGPLTNIVLAIICVVMIHVYQVQSEYLNFFLRTNLFIACFNLLPALPLDGGRMLRAHLSQRVGYQRATHITSTLGRWLAITLFTLSAVWAYYGQLNISLVVVAVFLYIASAREKQAAVYAVLRQITRKKEELNRRGVLPSVQLTAMAVTPLKDIIRLFEPQKYHWIMIVDESLNSCGLISEAEIMDGLLTEGLYLPVNMLLKQK